MTNTLRSGERLQPGESLHSANGEYDLNLQVDGNLVLFHHSTGVVKWSTHTEGKSVAAAVMQPDGNFVLYGYNNEVRWATNSSFRWRPPPPGSPPFLVVDDEGAVVIFGVIWPYQGPALPL